MGIDIWELIIVFVLLAGQFHVYGVELQWALFGKAQS